MKRNDLLDALRAVLVDLGVLVDVLAAVGGVVAVAAADANEHDTVGVAPDIVIVSVVADGVEDGCYCFY